MQTNRSPWMMLLALALALPACRGGGPGQEEGGTDEPTASALQRSPDPSGDEATTASRAARQPAPQEAASPGTPSDPPRRQPPPQEKPVQTTAGDPALAAIDAFIAQTKIDTSAQGWREKLPRPPQATFAEGSSYHWNLTTNQGEIKIRLMPDVAPMHVSSTIYLTRLGFYDDLVFHRVISGFMAQGGCPRGDGRGGPGYKYAGETSRSVLHDKPGLLSMANAGPNTDGSQFFLTFVPTPHLNGKHTIFGEVVDGMDTVKALESHGSRGGQPRIKLLLEKASITVE